MDMISSNPLKHCTSIPEVCFLFPGPWLRVLQFRVGEGGVPLVSIVEASEQSGRALRNCIDQGFVGIFFLELRRPISSRIHDISEFWRTNLQIVALDEPRIVSHGQLYILQQNEVRKVNLEPVVPRIA
jgi:hypothetical protein